MSGDISLFDLVNASIGTPEPGAVNFSALHALLHAMLEHLHIQHVNAVWNKDSDAGRGPGEWPLSAGCPQNPYRGVQDKLQHIEQQLAALERLPSGSELLAGSGSVNDVWQLLQLRRRVEASEDGVTKCVALIQDLLAEIKELKESRDSLKKEVENLQIQFNQMNVEQLIDKVAAVEQCLHRVEELKSATEELKEKVTLYPEPEELTQCVTWEVMQAALVSERQKTMKELKDSITGTGLLRPPVTAGITLTRRASSAAGLPGSSESPPVSTGPVSGSSHIPSSQQGLVDLVSKGDVPQLSRVSSGAQHYPETVEALRNVGRLQEKHESLEARVKFLEGGKADHEQVQQLQDLLSDMGERDTPEGIQEQLNHLNALMETVMADRDKGTVVESLMMGTEREMSVSESSELRTERTDPQQLQHLQTVHLRNAVQKLHEEVQKLKHDVAAANLIQTRSSDKQQQDQLDPQPTLQEVTAPQASLLQESAELDQRVQDEADGQGQGQSWSQAEGQGGQAEGQGGQAEGQGGQAEGQGGQAGPKFLSDSVDLGRKVSQLFQHYETLRNTVRSFMKQQNISRTAAQGAEATSELASEVQGTILCLQSECEQLHTITNHLQEDQSQKQSRIDYLQQAVEELEKKKADRELVEMKMGIKADKQALETKVSLTQFDTKTEQLNGMFEELLSRVTCQEQDWNKFIDKISTEMESKLNRIELEPLKQQLEDRWRSIRKQLQVQPAPEHDEAAGFRKQLVARFNCISCDRPVDMITPGPHLLTLPSAPGFPCHKSSRPYTVYELEQVRQHKSERIPEMANYGYLTMSRSCGGNHTLTYANRRYSHLQHVTQLIHTEEDGLDTPSSALRLHSEVDILGVDGHIYKGRMKTRAVKTMESRLPNISLKEGSCKSKDWGSRCQTQKGGAAEPGRGSPLRPQSAKTQASRSASSSSVKDRPVTSADCLSQPVPPRSSTDPHTELLQGGELLRDFSQSQNTPVTSL